MICHYCYFKDGFKYQLYVYNACDEIIMTVQNLSDFCVVTIKNVDYRVYITGVIISFHYLDCFLEQKLKPSKKIILVLRLKLNFQGN